MYSSKPAFIYGFHGLDKEIAYQILNHEIEFNSSKNDYDWLGEGIYFWENNLKRAEEYAKLDSKRQDSKIKEPFVLGAIIDLGNCLDLLDQNNLYFLSEAYTQLKKILIDQGKDLPVNSKFGKKDFDFKKRELDCAVIRFAHELARQQGVYFDSVRAAFWEGELLYENAGFRKQNHIQISIINPNCIKGIFLPRKEREYRP